MLDEEDDANYLPSLQQQNIGHPTFVYVLACVTILVTFKP